MLFHSDDAAVFTVYSSNDDNSDRNNSLVPSRDRVEWILGTVIGDYVGTTIGIHSPIPY